MSYRYYKGFRQQKWPSNSLKVISNHAIRYPIYGFLFVFHCNYVSILHRFRDSITYLACSAKLPTGQYILPSVISSLFVLWAKLSQDLLDRFSRFFHQNGRYLREFSWSDSVFPQGTLPWQPILWQNYLSPYIYSCGIPKQNGISLPQCAL